ncbi:MAG: S8 family serine peptidase [Candidatus Zixiibacteriota bacterium]
MKSFRTLDSWFMAVAIGFCFIPIASADTDLVSAPIPGRFVVKLAPKVPAAAVNSALAPGQSLQRLVPVTPVAGKAGREQWDRVFVLSADPTTTADQIKLQLGGANVEYVEPEYRLEFFDFPADPLFDYQWYLNNTGQYYWAVQRIDGDFNDTLALIRGIAGNDLGLDDYYQSPPPVATRVVVAVVDTGVDPDHPELQGRFWRNADEIADNGIDDDHNGYIDDTLGYDVSGDTVSVLHVVGDNDPSDDFGHGTHIAGIIAAAHNQSGVAGIAEAAEIMAVKIRPNGTTIVGSMGIVYAVNSGADIINISWGTPFESLLLKDAVTYARDNGVLVCVAAGNSGRLSYYYPASLDEVFTVAAGGSDGLLTSFSTYGPFLDLCAPGQNILSLRATGTDMYGSVNEPGVHIIGADSLYYLADGTSMAAPMIAGAAALIWSVRPQLTLDQLVSDLKSGARDMLDPLGLGDSLPGFDSLSGYGYIDVDRTLQLSAPPGMFFVSPEPRSRHTGQMIVLAAPIGGYGGAWTLACALDSDPDNWRSLAAGDAPPADSLLYVLSDPLFTGPLTFRLTDSYGTSRYLQARLVADTRAQLSSPTAGAEYDYNVPIAGSVYGPEYQSLSLYYRRNGGPRTFLFESGGEYFDSLIFSWNASGIELGQYTVYLEADFGTQPLRDSVTFQLKSAFAEGWPQELAGRGGLSATVADLDHDGTGEVIVGTTYGLNVFHSDGRLVDGFPALYGSFARCLPAVYDVDRDGFDEIICSSDSGLYVFKHDGTLAPGWPVRYQFGYWGYGAPNPSVTRLDIQEDSAIVLLDWLGNMRAYDFNGNSYFYSLEGWFGSFNQQPSLSSYFNGNCLSGADLDGDGYNEIVVSYFAIAGYSGVGLFDGRTGQPAFGRPLPYIIEAPGVFGTLLADLNGDGLLDVVSSVYNSTGVPTIWAKTLGTQTLPGWPRALPEIEDWLGLYPTAADLDLDGVPEILATYYEFDIGVLYIFRADGSPYVTIEGRPAGEAFRYAATFGAPIAANLVGDSHPEIVIRSGYLFPGTGREKVHILDHTATPIPGWPVATPTDPSRVFSTPYAPMVDDIDDDGLVELVLVSEGLSVFVWDFEASVDNGRNRGRLLMDNVNSSIYDTARYNGGGTPTDTPNDPTFELPRQFALHQNYPNPFNPSTAITFELPARAFTRLEVFNILGQTVAVLVDQELPAGSHTVQFDGNGVASGAYLYRLRADSNESTRKMVLLK